MKRDPRETRVPKPRLTYDQLVKGSVCVVMASSNVVDVDKPKRLYRIDKEADGFVICSIDKKKGSRNQVHKFLVKPTEDEIRSVFVDAGLVVDSIIWRKS